MEPLSLRDRAVIAFAHWIIRLAVYHGIGRHRYGRVVATRLAQVLDRNE